MASQIAERDVDQLHMPKAIWRPAPLDQWRVPATFFNVLRWAPPLGPAEIKLVDAAELEIGLWTSIEGEPRISSEDT